MYITIMFNHLLKTTWPKAKSIRDQGDKRLFRVSEPNDKYDHHTLIKFSPPKPANYTLRNGTERNGTTLGVHDRVEIKLLLPIKKAFLKISSFSHIM